MHQGLIQTATALLIVLALASCGRGGDAPRTISPIPSPAAAGSSAPHLAVAADGSVVMSWLEPAADGRQALRFATLDGELWSAPRTVAEGADWFVNWADFPSVTPITTRDWAAHWLVKQPGSSYASGVAIAISHDGGASWSAPLTPHDDGTLTEHGFVTLFPWDDGFGAVWLDGRYTRRDSGASMAGRLHTIPGMTVRYARFRFDGTVHESGEIDELACDCCATDVALVAGAPVLTWRDRTLFEIRDIAVSRYTEGAWQPPVMLGNDQWKMPGCPVNGSTLDARGEHVAVAWYAAHNSQPRVQLARSDDGGRSFGTAVTVAERDVSGKVDVVLLDDNSALVSWIARPAQGLGQILMRRIPATGAPGPAQLVAEGEITRTGGFPQMVAGAGRIVYAWTDQTEPSRVLTAWSPID